MKILAVFTLVSALATGAIAHFRLDTATAKNGALIAKVPVGSNVTFAADLRLTRVDMTHQGHPSVGLELVEQNNFDRGFTVPLQGMEEGTYRIETRGLGAHVHPMQHEFTFTVD